MNANLIKGNKDSFLKIFKKSIQSKNSTFGIFCVIVLIVNVRYKLYSEADLMIL